MASLSAARNEISYLANLVGPGDKRRVEVVAEAFDELDQRLVAMETIIKESTKQYSLNPIPTHPNAAVQAHINRILS